MKISELFGLVKTCVKAGCDAAKSVYQTSKVERCKNYINRFNTTSSDSKESE